MRPDYKPKIFVKSREDTSDSSQQSENTARIHFPLFIEEWKKQYSQAHKIFSKTFESNSLDSIPYRAELSSSINAFRTFWDPKLSAPMVPGVVDFWKEILNRNPQTVYFLDKYFSIKHINRIFLFSDNIRMSNEVPAFKIMIITGAVPSDRKASYDSEYDQEDDNVKYENSKNRLDSKIHIAMRDYHDRKLNNKVSYHILDKESCDLIHDRFVVIDGESEKDCCFWHFGASAGGMAARLNAYSGPWPDKDRRFCKFIESLLPKKDDDGKPEFIGRSGYGNK